MIKEKELAYYRSNIIDKYVIEVMTQLEALERKLQKQNDINFKHCKHCKELKPLSDFYKNPLKKQGVFDYCKECGKAMRRRRANERNRERERNLTPAVPT